MQSNISKLFYLHFLPKSQETAKTVSGLCSKIQLIFTNELLQFFLNKRGIQNSSVLFSPLAHGNIFISSITKALIQNLNSTS